MPVIELVRMLLAAWFALAPALGGLASQLSEEVAALRQPRSARFEVMASATADDETFAVRGGGAYARPDRYQLAFDVQGERYEQIIIGREAYYRAPGSTRWERLEVDPERSGFSQPGLTELSPDEREAVAALLDAFALVDTPSLNGVPTRHYHGEFDLLPLLEAFAPEGLAGGAALQTARLTLEVWIGVEDRYLHQLRLGLELQRAAARPAAPERLRLEAVLRVSDFDQPLRIEAPGRTPVQAPIQLPRT